MLRAAAVSLGVVVLLLLASCGSPGTAGTPKPSPSGTAAIEGGEAGRLPNVSAPRPQATPTPSGAMTQQQYATAVFTDIQAMWSREFSRAGIHYRPARLVLFSSEVTTSCGTQPADVGPFYCPGDDSVYIDLAFLTALQQHLNAPGDFARAYIIAHEVGHHVQNLLGISSRATAAQQASPAHANAISVRVELQADCLAGVWAHSAYQRQLLKPGDLQDALTAAAAVGDDFQQQLASGQVEPDSWSHGSSAQRVHWLETGFDSGDVGSCDTFNSADA